MKRFLPALAVVWTLLAAGILVELYRIDHALQSVASPFRGLAAWNGEYVNDAGRQETEAERKARKQAEMQRMMKDIEYAVSAPTPSAQSSRSTRRIAPPSDPRPSPGK